MPNVGRQPQPPNFNQLAKLYICNSYPYTPEQPWLCIGIYGPPHPDLRINLWQYYFPSIFNNINPTMPWILLGYLNDILNQLEKKKRKTNNICTFSTNPNNDVPDEFYGLRFSRRPLYLDKQPYGAR